LADGDYFTVVATSADVSWTVPALPPPPVTAADDFEMIGVNGVLSRAGDGQEFGDFGYTATNNRVPLASDDTTTGGAELKVDVTPNGLSPTEFVPPTVRDYGAYTAIVDLTDNPPSLLWCDDYALNGDGTSACSNVAP
jgi:hypothetical protein